MTSEQVAEYMPSAICSADRIKPNLPAVDAWEAEKLDARRSWLWAFAKTLAYAAAVAMVLKAAGGL